MKIRITKANGQVTSETVETVTQERRNSEKRLKVVIKDTNQTFCSRWYYHTKQTPNKLVLSTEERPTPAATIALEAQSDDKVKCALAEEFDKAPRNPRQKRHLREVVPIVSETAPKRHKPVVTAQIHLQDGHVTANVSVDGVWEGLGHWLRRIFSK